MKIHGMVVLKNEADVLEESLGAAAEWCHSIYVLDNGSDDGSWDLVQRLSSRIPAIVPWKQDGRPFHSGIREDLLRHFAHRAAPEDWWCILDVDEFYIDDPRLFLANVPAQFQVVWKHDYSYYFTDLDLIAYRDDPERYGPGVPIGERFRYYSADWSEIRFFRHPAGASSPTIPWHSPHTYPRRIRLKHFQYRSPEQIQKRLDTRRALIQSGIFAHESRRNWVAGATGEGFVPGPSVEREVPASWEERVVPAAGLHYDHRDGQLAPGKPWLPPEDPAPAAPTRQRAGGAAPRRSLWSAVRRLLRG